MGSKSVKRLCKLTKEGLLKDDPQAFVKLIQSADHYCRDCGRSAASEQRLCKPRKLSAP